MIIFMRYFSRIVLISLRLNWWLKVKKVLSSKRFFVDGWFRRIFPVLSVKFINCFICIHPFMSNLFYVCSSHPCIFLGNEHLCCGRLAKAIINLHFFPYSILWYGISCFIYDVIVFSFDKIINNTGLCSILDRLPKWWQLFNWVFWWSSSRLILLIHYSSIHWIQFIQVFLLNLFIY